MTDHVYPLDDLREHEFDGTACWCDPLYDEEFDLVIHNSLDGREEYARGRKMS